MVGKNLARERANPTAARFASARMHARPTANTPPPNGPIQHFPCWLLALAGGRSTMSEMLVLIPWRHIKRLPAGLLGSLHGVSTSKRAHWTNFLNHSRPSALASILFLSFGARCRSGARGHGLFEARLPRARPLEVRRDVDLDRSFVRKLWRPLIAGATRTAANIMICHLI